MSETYMDASTSKDNLIRFPKATINRVSLVPKKICATIPLSHSQETLAETVGTTRLRVRFHEQIPQSWGLSKQWRPGSS